VILGFLGRILSGKLRRKRCAFAGSFESLQAGTGPSYRIPHGVGDRNDGIIESGLNMNDARRYILFNNFLGTGFSRHLFLSL
jgi:hypothetical protein